MCNLGEALYQKGFDVGFEQGFQIGFERGFQIGFERGFQIGFVKGANDLVQLLINLYNQGRMADLDKALHDKEAREKFYIEFGFQR